MPECLNIGTNKTLIKDSKKKQSPKIKDTMDLHKSWRTIDQHHFQRLLACLAQVVQLVCTKAPLSVYRSLIEDLPTGLFVSLCADRDLMVKIKKNVDV